MLVANACSACVDLQQSKSNHHRAILYVTGDALRVVDEISKVCQYSKEMQPSRPSLEHFLAQASLSGIEQVVCAKLRGITSQKDLGFKV